MNIIKSIKNSIRCKSFMALAVTGALGVLVGSVAMNEYNYRVDRPTYAAYGQMEAMLNLNFEVKNVFKRGDERQTPVYEFLSSQGSYMAYLYRIDLGRSAAFKANNITSKHFDEASIAATDTHASDALLLEAMDTLTDRQLYFFLGANAYQFDQSVRSGIRERIEKNEYTSSNMRFWEMRQLHSSLSELERSKIQECYNKLKYVDDQNHPTLEQIQKAGTCSNASKFKPYVMWEGQYDSFYDRFMNAVGL